MQQESDRFSAAQKAQKEADDWTVASEVKNAVFGGALNAAGSVIETGKDIIDTVSEKVFDHDIWNDGREKNWAKKYGFQTKTTLGSISQSIIDVGLSFWGASAILSKLGATVKLAEGASKTARVGAYLANQTARSALVDATNSSRDANSFVVGLAANHWDTFKDLAEFLDTKNPNDGAVIRRAKGVLGGFVDGTAIDSVLWGLRSARQGWKAMRQGGLIQAAHAAENVSKEAASASLRDKLTAPLEGRAKDIADRTASYKGTVLGQEFLGETITTKGGRKVERLIQYLDDGTKRTIDVPVDGSRVHVHVNKAPEDIIDALKDTGVDRTVSSAQTFTASASDATSSTAVTAENPDEAAKILGDIRGGRTGDPEAYRGRPNINTGRPELVSLAQHNNDIIETLRDRTIVTNQEFIDRGRKLFDTFMETGGRDVLEEISGNRELVQELSQTIRDNHSVAMHLFEAGLARPFIEANAKYLIDPTNQILKTERRETITRLFQGFAELSEMFSESGRNLQTIKAFGKVSVDNVAASAARTFDTSAAKAAVDRLSDEAIDLIGQELHRLSLKGTTLTPEVFKLLKAVKAGAEQNITEFRKWWVGLGAVSRHLFYGSTLSTPATLGTNALTGVLKIASRGLEESIAGACRGAIDGTGLFKGLSAGKHYYSGVADSLGQAVRNFKHSLRYNRGIIAETGFKGEGVQGFGGYLAGTDPNVAAKILGVKGVKKTLDVWSVPMRIMGACDEFCKALAAGGEVSVRLQRELSQSGILKGLTGEAREKALQGFKADFIAKHYEDIIDGSGRLLRQQALRKDSPIRQAVLEATWQQDIDDRVGKAVFNALNSLEQSLPGLGFLVAPFKKTPYNLARDAWHHSPLEAFTFYKHIKAGDAEGAAQAFSHLMTGAALWSTAYMAFSDGTLTGPRPRNKAVAEAWDAQGIQPYSIKMGDQWVGLQRLDPFATPLKVLGNWFDFCQSHPEESTGRVTFEIFSSFLNTLKDSTYLKSVGNLTGPDGNIDFANFLQSAAIAYIPGALTVGTQAKGDIMIDAQSLIDRAKAKTGFTEGMGDKISWLTGLPKRYDVSRINPINTTHADPSSIWEAVAKIESGIGAPSRSVGGVDLDSNQYSRLCELHGTLRLGGDTLQEAIGKTLQSSGWSNAEADPDEEHLSEDHQTILIGVIRRYRNAAKDALLAEDPTLAKAVHASRYAGTPAGRGVNLLIGY